MRRKLAFKKTKLHMIKLLFVKNRIEYLKKQGLFYHIGEGCLWQPYSIPSEPYLVSLGDNVKVTAGVRFITHDITPAVFGWMGYPVHNECLYYMDKIVIGNNVMIGADSIIMPGVTIGNNVIIAAGTVVSKDVPSGSVIAGAPYKIIGTFDELAKKRYMQCEARPCHLSTKQEIYDFFWKENI